MASEVEIKGLAELQAALDQLPVQIEKKLMRGALRAGQKVVLEQARGIVHSVSGDLAASMRISTGIKGSTVYASVKVGNKKSFYARWVEFGTKAHQIKAKGAGSIVFGGIFSKSVHHPGAKAKPFMRPALDAAAQNGSAAFQAVAEYLRGRITKELSKLPDETSTVTK